jgi:hypothetical protein
VCDLMFLRATPRRYFASRYGPSLRGRSTPTGSARSARPRPGNSLDADDEVAPRTESLGFAREVLIHPAMFKRVDSRASILGEASPLPVDNGEVEPMHYWPLNFLAV